MILLWPAGTFRTKRANKLQFFALSMVREALEAARLVAHRSTEHCETAKCCHIATYRHAASRCIVVLIRDISRVFDAWLSVSQYAARPRSPTVSTLQRLDKSEPPGYVQSLSAVLPSSCPVQVTSPIRLRMLAVSPTMPRALLNPESSPSSLELTRYLIAS